MKKLRLLLTLVALTIISLAVYSQTQFQALNQESSSSLRTEKLLKINDQTFRVEVVKEPVDIARGLSDRSYLPKNQGMLFEFNPAQEATFWMREMLFEIDIVWIKDNKIIGIDRNLPIPTTTDLDKLPLFPSPGKIDYALELNVNETSNLSVGDRVEFILINSQ